MSLILRRLFYIIFYNKYNCKVDIILSHTCPKKYEPTEVFLKGLDQSLVDKSTEEWLDSIEKKTDYKKWCCGHYHTSKKIDKMQFMFENFDVLSIRFFEKSEHAGTVTSECENYE